MKLAEVIGHQETKDKLSDLITSDRLPHAMMILGPEGSGGLPLALAIAQNLVCERRSGKKQEPDLFAAPSMFGDLPPIVQDTAPLSDACGECAACLKAAKFIHPDIHFTFPTVSGKKKSEAKPIIVPGKSQEANPDSIPEVKKKNKAPISADFLDEWRKALSENPYMNNVDWLQRIRDENQLGNITVNECHEIIKHLSLQTFESRFKIQIIWMAEYLGDAGNTLLKIIEEPPVDTIFILVVENVELVLRTIISRTQLFKLTAIDDHDLAKYLMGHFEIDERTALRIARISDGNLNAALEYAGGAEHQSDALLRDWLSLCLRIKSTQAGESSVKLLEVIETIAKAGRDNQKVFLKYFLWFLRESNLLAMGLPSDKLEGTELDFAKKFSTILDPETTERLNILINRIYYHIDRYANPKILFLSTSFKIASILRKEEVAYNGD